MNHFSEVDPAGPPPADWRYASAWWLIQRHPYLLALLRRLPSMYGEDEDGRPDIDLNTLADAFLEYDLGVEDEDDDRNPTLAHLVVVAFAAMSTSERVRLRLLATFGGFVPISVGMLSSLDTEGQQCLADWCEAVKAS